MPRRPSRSSDEVRRSSRSGEDEEWLAATRSCRNEGVPPSYIYALSWMSPTIAATVVLPLAIVMSVPADYGMLDCGGLPSFVRAELIRLCSVA